MIIVNSVLAGLVLSMVYYLSRYQTDEELNKAGITWGKFIRSSSLIGVTYLIISILVDILL